jgi:hypothetical protein
MAFSGNYVVNSFRSALLNGDVDFAVDTIKIALYTSSATLNETTTAYTTDNEVSAPGYTAGGITLVPTVATDATVAFVSFEDVSWSSALTARGALIYKEGGTAIAVLDFGTDKVSTTSFVIQFPPGNSSSAILRLA